MPTKHVARVHLIKLIWIMNRDIPRYTEIYRVYLSNSILIIFAVHFLCWSLLQWLHCPLGHHWVWCVWHINGLSKLAVIYFVANIDCIYIYQDVVILVEYLVCHICWKGLIDTTCIYDTHRRIKNLFYLYVTNSSSVIYPFLLTFRVFYKCFDFYSRGAAWIMWLDVFLIMDNLCILYGFGDCYFYDKCAWSYYDSS